MSSIENTTVLNTEKTLSRKHKNIIQEYEEEINLHDFDDDFEVHNQSISGGKRIRNFKYGEQENKEKRREKQLEKEYGRKNHDPLNRQGKNAKKASARLAIVLNDERPMEVELMKGKNSKKLAAWIEQRSKILSEQSLFNTTNTTKLFGRLKRKPGHRVKPEIPILEIEDNELEFPMMGEDIDEVDCDSFMTG
jgi:hypothetical protein